MELKPHQQRVIEEKRELDHKIGKLDEFIRGAVYQALDVDERHRLVSQSVAMTKYSEILGERIAAFHKGS